eukprot:RCo047397
MEAQVTEVFETALGPKLLAMLDAPVVAYLVDVLHAQTARETAAEEAEVVGLLGLFLHNCRCYGDPEAAKQAAAKMVETLRERGLLPKPLPVEAQSTRLAAPVQLGRLFERTVADAARLGVATQFSSPAVEVNTNEDLNWEERREQAREQRRRRKEDEKKAAVLGEYEEFLARRGISTSAQAVKIHRGTGDWKGSEDVNCLNIHINMGKQVLLDKADLHLASGHRYGLVGRNGVGKTTLLRFLAEGELEGVSPYLQILHIEQEYNGDDRTALQAVLDTDVERNRLLDEEAQLLAGNVPADSTM